MSNLPIDKIIPAVLNNAIELQPALATFKFDFALWKVDAPKEFEGVGSALSSLRKDDAENGTSHTTARKLAALFESLLPLTPNVTKAYGQRASEISEASSITPQARSRFGVFSGQAGPDATSIWAAATSGSAAVAIHLLACMLARMWDGPEATSIWVEIVQRRKSLVKEEMGQNNVIEFTTLAAARQELSRTQLAEWDASARAWLHSADTIKNKEQKQLMLILDNMKGSVNRMTDTYESVITAWQNSLTQMEGLIKGISQHATNGDILVALSAWHLFPDMMVADPYTANIRQNDPIFNSGGVLTVGLDKSESQTASQSLGLYWSLPLSSLRYYGAPVVSSGSLNSNERSRLSLTEFLQSFLGCFLQGWGEAGLNTCFAAKWLSQVFEMFKQEASAGSVEADLVIEGDAQYSWLSLLFSAARYHITATGNERLVAKKLVLLGRKYGKDFLGLPRAPLFGLLHRGAFIRLIQTEDEQIYLLRKVAKDIQRELRLESPQMLIRYRHSYTFCSKNVYEFATAVPTNTFLLKRKYEHSEHHEQANQVHCRWLYAGQKDLRIDRLRDERYYRKLDQTFGPTSSRVFHVEPWLLVPADFFGWHARHGKSNKFTNSDRYNFDAAEIRLIEEEFESRRKSYQTSGENISLREDEPFEDFSASQMGIFWDQTTNCDPPPRQEPWYKFIYGDINSAAIFVMNEQSNLIDLIRSKKQDSQELYALFESNQINPTAVVKSLSHALRLGNSDADPHVQSAKAVSTAANIYRNFPDATIDVRVLQRKLWEAHWVQSTLAKPHPQPLETSTQAPPACLSPYVLDRASAFACITMFDSGRYDASPAELEDVMALASGNSLYIAAALLTDPSVDSMSGDIKRVAGNIGRPGIAFLTPPLDPLIKEASISEWPDISNNKFDGRIRDCFKGTSLHLSFTGASVPLNLGFSGAQDADVYILETLISVHDGGKWIADLNVLDTFKSANLTFFHPSNEQKGFQPDVQNTQREIISIDNWTELLDVLEDDVCLVQAHGNWEARLATCSVAVAKGYNTVIIPRNVSWSCVENNIRTDWRHVHPLVIIL